MYTSPLGPGNTIHSCGTPLWDCAFYCAADCDMATCTLERAPGASAEAAAILTSLYSTGRTSSLVSSDDENGPAVAIVPTTESMSNALEVTLVRNTVTPATVAAGSGVAGLDRISPQVLSLRVRRSLNKPLNLGSNAAGVTPCKEAAGAAAAAAAGVASSSTNNAADASEHSHVGRRSPRRRRMSWRPGTRHSQRTSVHSSSMRMRGASRMLCSFFRA